MTAFSKDERDRRRRHGAVSAAILGVVLALLAQATLPHVHLVRVANETPVRGTCVDAIAPESATALAEEAPAALPEHSESRCPVCQTLAHSHDLLPASAQSLVHVDLERHTSAPAPSDGPSYERVTAHAPRSPPVPA